MHKPHRCSEKDWREASSALVLFSEQSFKPSFSLFFLVEGWSVSRYSHSAASFFFFWTAACHDQVEQETPVVKKQITIPLYESARRTPDLPLFTEDPRNRIKLSNGRRNKLQWNIERRWEHVKPHKERGPMQYLWPTIRQRHVYFCPVLSYIAK